MVFIGNNIDKEKVLYHYKNRLAESGLTLPHKAQLAINRNNPRGYGFTEFIFSLPKALINPKPYLPQHESSPNSYMLAWLTSKANIRFTN